MEQVFLRITVMHSRIILIISEIMGWVYFVAWSVSFYPQIYINFKRKSVVGLNFDFLALNIMGFILYSVFNCGLFFSEAIQVRTIMNKEHYIVNALQTIGRASEVELHGHS